MSPAEVMFDSAGVACSGWHFPAAGDRLAGPAGRPAVVMAHGFGGTKDSGLAPFAERFAAAGADVLAFDFRGFGASHGQPRQSISIKRQIQDYHAAVAAAQRLAGVDPDRVVLWGPSLSGGHVLRVAADRDDVAAVIAMTPLTNGLAVGRAAVVQSDLPAALRWTLTGVKSRVAVAAGRDATLMPLVGRPGAPGALALDGAYESYLAIAGPTWRNEVDCAVGLEVGLIRANPSAKRLRCPLLVQVADFDRYVPASSVIKTAVHGRAQVRHYPCDHFDVWPGHPWFERVAEHQVAFLARLFEQS
ncbi:alpha/beta hydrolase [Mycobacterium talmoniae]|uniref:Alpha/beta hydrolase n=2 Tax=Mycobacterium talmoniae TaxID=1858794 RepID=A0A1S1N8T7_9MYCO|nr:MULTISPECIES: alpha/beta fold hydrolase [Mycobacterium]OHU96435.1 alpha/beta hydrolase [Mycobacterium talmoniae]TDH52261.1 alpha/beta fold hydrolase [Mycobacterium eburneum]